MIKNKTLKAAEKKMVLKEFGKDLYIEFFRHGLEEESGTKKILGSLKYGTQKKGIRLGLTTRYKLKDKI